MIDPFVILTPFLLLGVIALLGFVGCQQLFGVVGGSDAPVKVTGIQPQSGSTQGGTPVTITGSAFQEFPQVLIGGLAASDVIVSDNSTITATTSGPHSSGAVDVTVTNQDGRSGTLAATDPNHFSYASVTNIGQTLVVPGVNNVAGATAQASVSFSDTPKLIVVTVAWPAGAGTLASLTVTGGSFQSLKLDSWSGYNVQTSAAPSVPVGAGGSVTVSAKLSSATTPSLWFMCVTVYDDADQANPIYSPVSSNSTTSGTITPINFNALEDSDMIYAVALAQTAASSFSGFTGQISPGPGFTAEQSSSYVLIEDRPTTAAGTVSVGADTTGTNAAKWYLIAVGIKHF